MSYFTYDTSVIISRRLLALPKMSSNFRLSSVVIMELTASASDDSERKVYEQLFHSYSADSSLIVPNIDDWLLASKVLFWLTQGRRRSRGGKLRRLDPGQSQRMALDVLLAVSARRSNAAVVTENWKDFRLIQRFCDVKVFSAAKFFKS
jgi:predicted nucleic acid-binding protein